MAKKKTKRKSAQPDELIKNSPYFEPKCYWSYDRETRGFKLVDGRRPAGYVVATPNSEAFDDPGIFKELPLVNMIRPRVKAWRENVYPGVTGITKRLLAHWQDPEERTDKRFFFCQLEAIETLIWLAEAPDPEKQGVKIPKDGGDFSRLCSKMATGTGKTIVMAMLIAWNILNKVTDNQDKRFSKNIFVVAPGLTVKDRLQVLIPDSIGNYYDEFNIVPPALRDKLRQGKVRVRNWHVLSWETEEKLKNRKSVDKRGPKSDEAYVREVLGEIKNAKNILIINDEAHHAWRKAPESKVKGVSREEIEEATVWINGLDRIQNARGILKCYDFSATPFAPTGKKSSEETLFEWIVSDFGLNDAIESGLVKTPRVVIRDDSGKLDEKYRSRLYHIYKDPEVTDDINRKAEAHEALPDLITGAYYLLGSDWLETLKRWQKEGHAVPPVMITVANRTETAGRIKFAFDHRKILIDQLCDPKKTLHIDSKVLKQAEEKEMASGSEKFDYDDDNGEPKLTKGEQAELLRRQVNTVGKFGEDGEQIQNVISVGMLSEGWDAKTVTHIMGLRAFSSQLLCEQVVGRGLRRTTYDVNKDTGLFDAEYVNIFGVPFTFMPHEGGDGPPPPPPPPKTLIQPLIEKKQYEIRWPNVIRVDHVYKPVLTLDLSKVRKLELNASDTPKIAQLAPTVEGKPDLANIEEIALDKLDKEFRQQKIIFEIALNEYDAIKPTWKGNRDILFAQLVRLVEIFIQSDRIKILPRLYNIDDLKRRIVITLNMKKVVQHIWEAIKYGNTESVEPVFDRETPIKSTDDMLSWYTGKPNEKTIHSHISHCVFDSRWESSEAFELDRNKNVSAWVKNDHLGFEVLYMFEGVILKYRPDFLIKLVNGKMLVLEVKGEDNQKNRSKRKALDEWVSAVNGHGGFGKWAWDVSFNPADVIDILDKHNRSLLSG